MGHPRARLSVFSRQLLVGRVNAGWPVAHVAEQLGISRATAYKWVRRFRVEGEPGLLDRPSRPHRSPSRLDPAVEAEILAARARWRYGPDRLGPLLGRPPSTVHRVLARRGFSRLRDADRVTAAPVRYVACHPGALIHQDHKKLGRIPDGGGWRVIGRERARRGHQPIGYDHLEVIVDDASRYAVVVPVPDETSTSAIGALELAAAEFARLGIRIDRVLTDNGTATRPGSMLRSPGWVPATSEPGSIAPRPTARPSGSSRPSLQSGPTADPTAPTMSARARSGRSSTFTIAADPTPRSAVAHPSTSSTTSVGTTASPAGIASTDAAQTATRVGQGIGLRGAQFSDPPPPGPARSAYYSLSRFRRRTSRRAATSKLRSTKICTCCAAGRRSARARSWSRAAARPSRVISIRMTPIITRRIGGHAAPAPQPCGIPARSVPRRAAPGRRCPPSSPTPPRGPLGGTVPATL